MSPNLRNYQQKEWLLIAYFQIFNINYVPLIHNETIDTLANNATMFSTLRDGFLVEIIYKPYMPNNVTNFHVFDDDNRY